VASLLIPDLDDATHARLQARAAAQGRSVAEETSVAHPDAALPAPTEADLVEAEALSEHAAAYARASLSPATWRAYDSHLKAWRTWCRAHGKVSIPAPPALVANYLAELAGTRSHATLTGRLDAIARAHAFLRLPFSRSDPAIRQTMAGIARKHGTRPQRQAAPLLTADVLRIAAACGGDLRGERDRALIMLGFAAALRRSELVAVAVGHLRFVGDVDGSGQQRGLSLFLPRSKTDQAGAGAAVFVAANPLSAHCPVVALRAWLDLAGITAGPVFRRIDRHGRLGRRAAPLSPEAVRLILEQRAEAAGYAGDHLARITPHSLRAGCITQLARASVHERDIMKHSRHGSATVMRGYIRAAHAELEATSAALWLHDDVRAPGTAPLRRRGR
jgi:integrase